MMRVASALMMASMLNLALAENAGAAVIAPLQFGPNAHAPDLAPAYYYRGGYYPYRWRGGYYRHRYYRYGRYHYY